MFAIGQPVTLKTDDQWNGTQGIVERIFRDGTLSVRVESQEERIGVEPHETEEYSEAVRITVLLGADAIRYEAERTHRNNTRQLGPLHAIWCAGQAILKVAVDRGIEPPNWWAEWKRGGELDKLAQIVNADTPAPTPDASADFVCHYCGQAATKFGFFDEPVCPECGG